MTTPMAPIPTTDRETSAQPDSPVVIRSLLAKGWRLGAGVLLSLSALSSCAPPPSGEPVAPSGKPAVHVQLRPLKSYVPAVGMRWLVQLRPQALMSHPRFSKDWKPVFASDRILAFTHASGADPHRIEEAFIAGYDLGELYLFDGRQIGLDAQKAFEARSLTTRELETQFDNLTHLTGIIEQTPHALVHIEGHLVAIAVGDIRLARIVRAYAEGKLKKSPSALEDRFLSIYESFHPEAPVRAFLRGPYDDTTDAVAAGFVTGVAAATFQESELRIHARALGAWPFDAELGARLTTHVDRLLSTRELRALGWGFPTEAPEVSCRLNRDGLSLCSSEGAWNSAAVAEALHRITAGTLKEVVEGTPPGWHPEATTRPDANEAAPTTETQSGSATD